MGSRQVLLIIALGVMALGGCKNSKAPVQASGGDAVSETPPARQPGLWKQDITLEGVDGVSSSTICLDPETDKKLAWWGQGISDTCQEHSLVKGPDGGWSFSSRCAGGGGASVATRGKAVGDFSNHYEVAGQVTVTGSPSPQLAGTKKFTISASYQGACPDDMPPGTMDVPGVGKVDALNVGAAR